MTKNFDVVYTIVTYHLEKSCAEIRSRGARAIGACSSSFPFYIQGV